MKRTLAIVAVTVAIGTGTAPISALLAQTPTQSPAPAESPAKKKPTSDSLVPIPGTGTAEVKGARLIGADVVNAAANEKLGDVDEVLVTTDGRVNAVVIATGGVLGIGERKVVLPWERLRFSSQGTDLVVMTDASRETLKAMPEYRDPSRASSEQMRPAQPATPPLGRAPADPGTSDTTVPAPGGGLDQSRPIRPVPPTDSGTR